MNKRKTTLKQLTDSLKSDGLNIEDFTVTEKRKYFECSNVHCKSKVYEDYEEGGYYYCLHCDEEHSDDEVKWKTEYKEMNKND